MEQLNPVIKSPAALRMSSREIASLTGKKHGHVMRDVNNMLSALNESPEGYIQNWTDPQNHQTYPQYLLTHDLTITLIAGYSIPLRHRIVKRWEELEGQVSTGGLQLPDFTNPAVAARAWADEVEQRQTLALENQHLSDENQHLQAHFTDGLTIVNFARTLNGVNIQQVQGALCERGWIRKEKGGWRVNAQYRDRYLAERVQIFRNPITTEEQERHYLVLLKAGACRLFKLYVNGQLPMKQNWNGHYTHGEALL